MVNLSNVINAKINSTPISKVVKYSIYMIVGTYSVRNA